MSYRIMISELTKYSKRTTWFYAIILTLHIGLMSYLFFQNGLNFGNEGSKYMGWAKEITEGKWEFVFRYGTPYLSYIFYLCFFISLNLNPVFIVLTTWILFILVVVKFKKTVFNLLGETSSYLWLVLMLTSPMINIWHLTLYSEIFFITIYIYFLSILFEERGHFQWMKILISGTLLFFCRPTGIFIVILGLIFYLFQNKSFSLKKNILYAFISITFVFLSIFFFVPFHFNGIILEVLSGSIYCGFRNIETPVTIQKDMTLYDAYKSVWQHHGLFPIIKNMTLKASSLFKLTRPHFSKPHNLINQFHYLLYLPFILMFFNLKSVVNKHLNLLFLCYSVICCQMVLTTLFFNEWSERYSIQIFPFVFLVGLVYLNTKTNRSKIEIELE